MQKKNRPSQQPPDLVAQPTRKAPKKELAKAVADVETWLSTPRSKEKIEGAIKHPIFYGLPEGGGTDIWHAVQGRLHSELEVRRLRAEGFKVHREGTEVVEDAQPRVDWIRAMTKRNAERRPSIAMERLTRALEKAQAGRTEVVEDKQPNATGKRNVGCLEVDGDFKAVKYGDVWYNLQDQPAAMLRALAESGAVGEANAVGTDELRQAVDSFNKKWLPRQAFHNRGLDDLYRGAIGGDKTGRYWIRE